jgi:SAM-dependent methyltransferase
MTAIRLDIGCGKNKREGFVGLDQFAMDGVDVVCKLNTRVWTFTDLPKEPLNEGVIVPNPTKGLFMFSDNSVDEVHSSHFLEHLTGSERVFFFNELYRIMKPGAKATIITPHWASNRAYGDFTHQWPPVSEMSFFYLSKNWRDTQAPHTDSVWNTEGYNCNFEATWGYGMRQDLIVRNMEYQQFAMQNYKEAIQDMHATLVKA